MLLIAYRQADTIGAASPARWRRTTARSKS
jgi:hypothetical protein